MISKVTNLLYVVTDVAVHVPPPVQVADLAGSFGGPSAPRIMVEYVVLEPVGDTHRVLRRGSRTWSGADAAWLVQPGDESVEALRLRVEQALQAAGEIPEVQS